MMHFSRGPFRGPCPHHFRENQGTRPADVIAIHLPAYTLRPLDPVAFPHAVERQFVERNHPGPGARIFPESRIARLAASALASSARRSIGTPHAPCRRSGRGMPV
jgi:hypothetical protein